MKIIIDIGISIAGGLSMTYLGYILSSPESFKKKLPTIMAMIIIYGISSIYLVCSGAKQDRNIENIQKDTQKALKTDDFKEWAKENEKNWKRVFRESKATNDPNVGKPNTDKYSSSGSSKIDTSLGRVRIASSLYNVSNGETYYNTIVNAKTEDELIYRITVTNDSDSTIKNVKFRTTMPPFLNYVAGYSKVYYEDENGIDRVSPVSDAISSENGIILADIPGHHYIYLTFNVKVNKGAPAGIYSADNQLLADGNISLSDNNGIVYVKM